MDLPALLPLLAILVQVLLIDLVLAGDNAVVIGLAVNGLPQAQRRQAIWYGIAGATIIRIAFALVALQMLHILGLTLAGGILLLWVVWKSARELHGARENHSVKPAGRLRAAIWRIIVADISMSLDNVLAVAGAAHDHPYVLATGLAVSVALMGIAATLVAKLLTRFHWLAWVGIAIVLYVSLSMIYEGSAQLLHHLTPA
ncbi:TerC family protein [Acidocella sp.]|uniref:TerC family protein n=1 Tax=Acidocella sp. TaxID=50710 RepID=UPI0026101285|nr:TerC family protein [Acidocella sp.]MDD2795547.1 TerC family protein [Acidocella sp.]